MWPTSAATGLHHFSHLELLSLSKHSMFSPLVIPQSHLRFLDPKDVFVSFSVFCTDLRAHVSTHTHAKQNESL